MYIDYLIAEIGSTTTVVSAFKLITIKKEDNYSIGDNVVKGNEEIHVKLVAQGKSYTSVLEGDVTIGLKNAIDEIENYLNEKIEWGKMLATSSAAGGLRITVHGLVEDMTVKAAREAALGAGGIIKMVTAGKLRKSDVKKIKDINPNIIMIAGGTDYGERETALINAEVLKEACINRPIIYCGNIANRDEIKEIFAGDELYLVDNVYPRIDELNVEPCRKVIQEAFEKNITKAPGMNKIRSMVNGAIMTTPGAVMESAKLLYDIIGDLVVIDVGGATTDVHSVTDGSSEILNILVSPEPRAKRTVEGDLGVYVNSENIINLLSNSELNGLDKNIIKDNIKPIPKTEKEFKCSIILTKKAVNEAVNRHVGYIKRIYGGSNEFVAYGKDLSKVNYIIGTGGALTRLPQGKETLENIRYLKEDLSMLPRKGARILLDNMYIMACAGVLSKENKAAAEVLLKESLGLERLL